MAELNRIILSRLHHRTVYTHNTATATLNIESSLLSNDVIVTLSTVYNGAQTLV